MLRPAWSMVLLHFRVGLSLRIYETSITRIRALEDYYVLSKVNTLNGCRPFSKGKPLNSNMVGWIYPFHPDTLIMIGWAIGGKVHIISSARKTEWWPIWALVHKSCKAPRHFLILISHHLSRCSKFSKYMVASSTCCLMTLVKFTTCGRIQQFDSRGNKEHGFKYMASSTTVIDGIAKFTSKLPQSL